MNDKFILNIDRNGKKWIDADKTDQLIVEILLNTTTAINNMCIINFLYYFSSMQIVDNILIESKNKDFYLEFSHLVIEEEENGNEYLSCTYTIESILIK